MNCDAIVNSTNSTLVGTGGADAEIHRIGGAKLDAACARLGMCPVGEARITKGYGLPCRYVIHTAGPIWDGGAGAAAESLRACYRSSLLLAKQRKCKSVALPLIGVNVLGVPRTVAMRTAVAVIGEFLLSNDMDIYLVVFGPEEFGLSERLFPNVQSYIDDHYAASRRESGQTIRFRFHAHGRAQQSSFAASEASVPADTFEESRRASMSMADTERFIASQLDESFSQMVLRKIDEKGMKETECYKRANLDRKLFSKLRGNPQYRPSKTTAIALGIALELPLDEMRELLSKAGYALSHSSKFDLIVEFFLRNGNYNIFEINEALFAFDQNLLGA